ncbi:MAG: hypothetical protein [Yanbian Rhabd tick virus 3]|uniref:Uncharacterized protein n=1 Tax=Yanbian Rhabd tick virus 3 TaxID=2972326 RepID=A0A9E7V2D3_9RHAB|nr:MAG: hypothetical protein [Yanbian Rhabd tick virus 3]WAK77160.1 MAG: hypothetical protein [Rhabdoviridae sp.]
MPVPCICEVSGLIQFSGPPSLFDSELITQSILNHFSHLPLTSEGIGYLKEHLEEALAHNGSILGLLNGTVQFRNHFCQVGVYPHNCYQGPPGVFLPSTFEETSFSGLPNVVLFCQTGITLQALESGMELMEVLNIYPARAAPSPDTVIQCAMMGLRRFPPSPAPRHRRASSPRPSARRLLFPHSQ